MLWKLAELNLISESEIIKIMPKVKSSAEEYDCRHDGDV